MPQLIPTRQQQKINKRRLFNGPSGALPQRLQPKLPTNVRKNLDAPRCEERLRMITAKDPVPARCDA